MVQSDSSRDGNNPLDNAIVNDKEQIETAKWTRHLPEAFGIRAAVQQSKYRWCVREAALWGIATGTTVSLHRLRMNSSVFFSINAGFLSCWVVYAGSYYFCFKRRDYQEKMIETMMKLNTNLEFRFPRIRNLKKQKKFGLRLQKILFGKIWHLSRLRIKNGMINIKNI